MDKDNIIGVVGLGYVGLTFATVLAEVGFKVLGVEKRQDVVDKTNSGKPHFADGQGKPEVFLQNAYSPSVER